MALTLHQIATDLVVDNSTASHDSRHKLISAITEMFNTVIEDCAKVCEEAAEDKNFFEDSEYPEEAAQQCAVLIRKLKDK